MVEDADGRLLFGTFGGGIAAYDGRGFQVYTTEHGLPSNDIFGLQPQADGSVRVLTTAGVGRFVEGRGKYMGGVVGWWADLLRSNQHSAIRQKRRPARQRGPVSERRPRGPDLDWHDRRVSLLRGQPDPSGGGRLYRLIYAQAVSCPDSTPEIQFYFQGTSFRSGAEPMRYSHRLVGHGPAEEWSAFTPANRVTYQDVPAGLFHFEVRTVDRDGLMSDIARLEMRVVPTHLRRLEQMLRVSNQGFLSQSQAMARLLDQVESMAETDMTVLVLGETGVGKGVLARLLHQVVDVPLQVAEAELALPVSQGFDGNADDEEEKQRILAALQAANWRIYGPRGAARLLGIGPEKLRYRMRKHGLQRPEKP